MRSMRKLRLIGDIHGDLHEIYSLIQTMYDYDLTIQLGDFGIGFGAEDYLLDLNPEFVRILQGNHDNPSLIKQFPHDLGRFGVFNFYGYKIFFVAGAWSIDQAKRKPGFTWWHDEELGFKEQTDCLDLWEEVCESIDLVISHDCPNDIARWILRKEPFGSATGRLLQEILKIHEPPLWKFGHWHTNFKCRLGKTEFQCLDINKQLVLNIEEKE